MALDGVRSSAGHAKTGITTNIPITRNHTTVLTVRTYVRTYVGAFYQDNFEEAIHSQYNNSGPCND